MSTLPPVVIIESPYAGDIERNVAYAWACLRDSCSRGEAPFASHLLYTGMGAAKESVREDGVGMNDPKHWLSREEGLRRCEAFRAVAKKTIFYCDHGWSSGMLRAKDHAISLGQPIEERSIWMERVVEEEGEDPEAALWRVREDEEEMCRAADEFVKLPWPEHLRAGHTEMDQIRKKLDQAVHDFMVEDGQ